MIGVVDIEDDSGGGAISREADYHVEPLETRTDR
jgi:hypothetical protein